MSSPHSFLGLVAACLLPIFAASLGTTSVRGLFIYDSHPNSLEASIVSLADGTTTYRVSCPTAASPENDSCRQQNYYPADVVHISGSSFSGTNLATASVTKLWSCDPGSGSDDVLPDQYGICAVTTVGPGAVMATEASTPVNTCFVTGHSVPVIITAGLDKVASFIPGTIDASALSSIYSSGLAEMNCPASATAAPTAAAAPSSPASSTQASSSITDESSSSASAPSAKSPTTAATTSAQSASPTASGQANGGSTVTRARYLTIAAVVFDLFWL